AFLQSSIQGSSVGREYIVESERRIKREVRASYRCIRAGISGHKQMENNMRNINRTFIALLRAGVPFVASGRARGIFGCLLCAAIVIFGTPSARANSIPVYSFSYSEGAYPYAGLSSNARFTPVNITTAAITAVPVFPVTTDAQVTLLHAF